MSHWHAAPKDETNVYMIMEENICILTSIPCARIQFQTKVSTCLDPSCFEKAERRATFEKAKRRATSITTEGNPRQASTECYHSFGTGTRIVLHSPNEKDSTGRTRSGGFHGRARSSASPVESKQRRHTCDHEYPKLHRSATINRGARLRVDRHDTSSAELKLPGQQR